MKMTNAEKFKQIFGLYATELWSMPESDFLEWLNRDVETTQIDHIAESGKKVERTGKPSQDVSDSDLISRKVAIDALARMMPRSYTPDGSHPADEEIFRAQEIFADCIEALEILPSAQPESTRTFVELVVRYPAPELCAYEEYKGKPYYSIKYIENGEKYVGYSTYNPKVLSQYLKEYFMPPAQPEKRWIPCSKRMPNNYDYQLLTEEVHYTTGKIVRGVLIAYYDDEDDVYQRIAELPAAQPEIIRCKDCKHWRDDHTCHEHSLVSPMCANEYCSRAERRTDERFDRQTGGDRLRNLRCGVYD